MDIDKLEAGPELDALVAREVMGWDAFGLDELWHIKGKRSTDVTEWGTPHACEGVTTNLMWRPSTDIASAWAVVEKMHERHCVHLDGGLGWGCKISDAGGLTQATWSVVANAETAPLSICIAALKAVLWSHRFNHR
jgi:Phage ABA sandwich domain